MKSSKGHQEEEEEDYEEFGGKRDNTPSSNTNKDGKSSEKANATRSKHSVTEQRRRSKINERFQILRDLIPNSDQKRDTASFLLEVIEYVQYLQEKVQKYEGSYPGWSAEPTKLMPWRNSHWRVPNFSHPPVIKSDCGQAPAFPVRFDESNVSVTPSINVNPQNTHRSDPSGDANCNLMDPQPELPNKTLVMPMPVHQADASFSNPTLHGSLSDGPSADPVPSEEELTIEGGTISISSVYSQGLLNSLTQALQNSGVDLSQATVSVQVDLGKRANKGLASGNSTSEEKNPTHSSHHPGGSGQFQERSNGEHSEQPQKRLKT